jgi:hypothetical protein
MHTADQHVPALVIGRAPAATTASSPGMIRIATGRSRRRRPEENRRPRLGGRAPRPAADGSEDLVGLSSGPRRSPTRRRAEEGTTRRNRPLTIRGGASRLCGDNQSVPSPKVWDDSQTRFPSQSETALRQRRVGRQPDGGGDLQRRAASVGRTALRRRDRRPGDRTPSRAADDRRAGSPRRGPARGANAAFDELHHVRRCRRFETRPPTPVAGDRAGAGRDGARSVGGWRRRAGGPTRRLAGDRRRPPPARPGMRRPLAELTGRTAGASPQFTCSQHPATLR